MKNHLTRIVFIAIISGACNNSSTTQTIKTDTAVKGSNIITADTAKVPVGDNTDKSIPGVGTYKAVLPCADCEGIETVIEINADSSYKRTSSYLGKDNAVKYLESGKWKWLNDSVIRLNEKKNSGPDKYLIEQDKLVQLDLNGKKIGGIMAEKYVFKRIK